VWLVLGLDRYVCFMIHKWVRHIWYAVFKVLIMHISAFGCVVWFWRSRISHSFFFLSSFLCFPQLHIAELSWLRPQWHFPSWLSNWQETQKANWHRQLLHRTGRRAGVACEMTRGGGDAHLDHLLSFWKEGGGGGCMHFLHISRQLGFLHQGQILFDRWALAAGGH